LVTVEPEENLSIEIAMDILYSFRMEEGAFITVERAGVAKEKLLYVPAYPTVNLICYRDRSNSVPTVLGARAFWKQVQTP
jgi:hypothetical protein